MVWSEAKVNEFWQHYDASFVADTTASEIIRLSKKHIKGKVLDVGAGSGALIDRIPRAVGIDIVSRHPMISQGTVSDMPFEDATFATVFVTDVIEHLPDDVLQKGMKEIYRVMKFGGKLIIVAPYRERLQESFVYCPNCGIQFHRASHLRTITEEYMIDLLNLSGFHAIEMRLVPLAFTARHWTLRHFWPIAVKIGLIGVRDMFVVAEKC